MEKGKGTIGYSDVPGSSTQGPDHRTAYVTWPEPVRNGCPLISFPSNTFLSPPWQRVSPSAEDKLQTNRQTPRCKNTDAETNPLRAPATYEDD